MMASRSAMRAVAMAMLALSLGRVIHAQQLRGVVRDSTSGLPIPGVVVSLLDAANTAAARTMTDERGQFQATVLGNAIRSLRLVRLGFRPVTIAVPSSGNGDAQLQIVMVSIPLSLQPVTVSASANCPRRNDRAMALALLEQARAGLLATVVARAQRPARMKLLRAHRRLAGTSDRIVHQSVTIDSGGFRGPFGAARKADDFVRDGFAVDSQGVLVYYGPDAEVLLDDRFSAGYCFHVMNRSPTRPNQVGLGFQPARRKEGRTDTVGALWIDTVARALVDIEYRYVGGDSRAEPFRPGGQTFFRTMPNGSVVIDRWWIRMAAVDSSGRPARATSPWTDSRTVEPAMRGEQVWSELARAEWRDTTWRSDLGRLRVKLSHPDGTAAAGTVVRLTDTDYKSVADSNGVVTIEDLVPGPYAIAVVDTALATLGITVGTPVRFTSTRDTTVTADLVVKTAIDYVRDRCVAGGTSNARPPELIRGDAWLIGRVTGPDGEPIAAKWSLSKRGPGGETRVMRDAEVGSDGIIQYCQLSRGETVVISFRAKGMIDASTTVTLTRQPTVISVQMQPRQ